MQRDVSPQVPVFTWSNGVTMAASQDAAKVGIGFGSALAITISWSLHQSILWACIHGFFSWFYVIYYAFTRG